MTDYCKFNPEKECLGMIRYEKLSTELANLREQSHSAHDKLWSELHKLQGAELARDEQYKHILDKLDNLADNISEFKRDSQETLSQLPSLVNKVQTLEENQKTLATDLEEIKSKSGKKWDSMIAQVTSIIVATVVGLVIGKMGL